jgi:hypothetical protein
MKRKLKNTARGHRRFWAGLVWFATCTVFYLALVAVQFVFSFHHVHDSLAFSGGGANEAFTTHAIWLHLERAVYLRIDTCTIQCTMCILCNLPCKHLIFASFLKLFFF